jgi:hypothetical protein
VAARAAEAARAAADDKAALLGQVRWRGVVEWFYASCTAIQTAAKHLFYCIGLKPQQRHEQHPMLGMLHHMRLVRRWCCFCVRRSAHDEPNISKALPSMCFAAGAAAVL